MPRFLPPLAVALRALLHHLTKHVGVGIICAIAYFDPGNWSVDLKAGSSFGYRPMLFVILMAGFGAIILQTLATRLGCVTGIDLASHCRLLLYNRTKRPRLVRYLVLYPLYVLSELAIISTDLAELLGSAIGFCLIFPKLPLYAGVILTAADVLVFLAISDPYKGHGRPVRTFEFVIIALVFAVFACFVALLVKAKPNWPDVFMGYIPDKTLVQSQPDAVYTAVGILGATVMPHALFLGSSLATQDRVSIAPIAPDGTPARGDFTTRIRRCLRALFNISHGDRADANRDYHTKHDERENNSLLFIRQHLSNGTADVVTSLLLIAVPINSAILIIAATVFYTDPNEQKPAGSVGLFEAHDLIKSRLGSGAAFIFALALIFAGQTSSVTVTLAGQLVSEGFIEWRMSPFLRRLITRLISLVPSVVVAVAVGKDGISTLLVASQVILSIVLPFVAFPLIYLTSSEKVMRVRKPSSIEEENNPALTSRADAASLIPTPTASVALTTPPPRITNDGGAPDLDDANDTGAILPLHVTHSRSSSLRSGESVAVVQTSSPPIEKERTPSEKIDKPFPVTVASLAPITPTTTLRTRKNDRRTDNNGYLDFSNSWLVIGLAYAIWCIVLVANAYAIVMLVVGWAH